MRNLLTTGNPKVVKSLKLGFLAAVLCLAPGSLVVKGRRVVTCAFAKAAGCLKICLKYAGRSGIEMTDGSENPIHAAQRARTELFVNDFHGFMARLTREITNLRNRARRQRLLPACRLNGLSDISWEDKCPDLFDDHSDVQFYDYTKNPQRFAAWMDGQLPPNYWLTFSWYLARDRFAMDALCDGATVAIVSMRSYQEAFGDATKPMYRGFPVIDGDAHDARWTDKPGVWVWLKAKGKARKNPDWRFMIK